MKLPPFLAPLLWPLASLAALGLGIPLGQALRSPTPNGTALSGVPRTASPPAASAFASSPQSLHGAAASDQSIEAEITRFLSSRSGTEGPRSTPQLLEAISQTAAQSSDFQRYLSLYEAIAALGKNDLPEALRRAKAENNRAAISALERRLAEVNPLPAAKLWAAGGEDSKLGANFFSTWARMNPSSAMEWYAGLPEGDPKKSIRNTLLDSVARSDPQRAIDFANQMPEGTERAQLVSKALETLTAQNPALAFSTARSLPEGASQKAALESVLSKIASKDPAQAKQLLAELPPNTLSTAAGTLGASLAKKTPAEAASWSNSLPDGPTKNAAIASVASTWAGSNVEAAAAWIDQLPGGPARDAAVVGFTAKTAAKDPEGATAWAATLSPGEQRNAALQRTLSIWLRRDPKATQAWIASAPGFSEAERESLAKAAQNPPDFRRFRTPALAGSE
ncbi:MAG: hypothetical protein RLZZ244_3184 [Verrucomicrobiota bacterium]